MQQIFANFKKNKIFFLLLFLVITTGIFLRTYNFHPWMRFSEDESRDGTIVDNVLKGNQPLPLLGPVASTSEFKLGPAYYYMQYISARIFGNEPAHLGYPDLFFSILMIPLLYLFLRKYFDRKVSLAVTALYCISFFAIKYSRFAWNPNSSPFFALLFFYSFLELVSQKAKKKYLWAALAGAALGIGIQLHTVFLLAVPLVFLVAIAYFLKKKMVSWKAVAVVIFAAAIFNIPQIAYEVKSHGGNSKAFVAEVFNRDEKGGSIFEKIMPSAFCQIQAHTMLTADLANDNRCNYFSKNLRDIRANWTITPTNVKFAFFSEMILGLIFLLGTYFLYLKFFRSETDNDKKNFLLLNFLFALFALAVLTPMIEGVYTRFLLPLEIIPFVTLGLWAKIISKKFERIAPVILFLLVALIAFPNFSHLKTTYISLAAKGDYDQNTTESMTLGEEEFLSNFIIRNMGNSKTVYLEGSLRDLFKCIEPMQYFFRNYPGFRVEILTTTSQPEDNSSIFLIKMIAQDERRLLYYLPEIYGSKILDKETYGRFIIYKLESGKGMITPKDSEFYKYGG